MAARLKGYTAVRDDDGITHSFGPNDEVPEWARKRITNPKLWDGDTAPDADANTAGGGGGGGNLPEPPPKGGKGSGEEEWRKYASHFPAVSIPEDADRNEIIDLLDEAGVRTE